MRFLIVALSALAALWAVPAPAQIGQGGGPVLIDAARAEVQNDAGRVIFEGQAEAVQGDARLRADRIEVEYERAARPGGDGQRPGIGSMGEMERVIATGNVYYVTPEETATGDRAVYELATETIVFTGNVTVKQGCDVSTGERLTVNLRTGDSQMAGQQDGDGGRVQVVLYPEGEAQQRDNCE